MKKWIRIISAAISAIDFIVKTTKRVYRSKRHIRSSDQEGSDKQRSGGDQKISGDAEMDDNCIGGINFDERLMASNYLNRKDLPRGIRNNNPSNIRRGNAWKGLVKNGSDTAFDQFETVAYGVRALYYTLHTYMTKYNLLSIKQIIGRYAPPFENKTDKYIEYVSKYLNRSADSKVAWTKSQVKELARAIIDIEVGISASRKYITDQDLNEGFALLPKSIQDHFSGTISPASPAMAKVNPVLILAALALLFSKIKI